MCLCVCVIRMDGQTACLILHVRADARIYAECRNQTPKIALPTGLAAQLGSVSSSAIAGRRGQSES